MATPLRQRDITLPLRHIEGYVTLVYYGYVTILLLALFID